MLLDQIKEPREAAPTGIEAMKHHTDDFTNELRAIINQTGIKRSRIAELCRVSPDTVDAWLKPDSSKSSRPTPCYAVELLSLKLRLPPPDVA